MQTQKIHSRIKILIPITFLAGLTLFTACKKEDDEMEEEPTTTQTENEDKSYTVTVGVFVLNGSSYEDQNKDLVFETQGACQSWSRTAQADNHSSSSHDHFNAAKNTTYDLETETITWTEFGPELDQSAIDQTCEDGSSGATKTANKTEYSEDKNFFLQIKSVVES